MNTEKAEGNRAVIHGTPRSISITMLNDYSVKEVLREVFDSDDPLVRKLAWAIEKGLPK